jgi:hypothetical protein
MQTVEDLINDLRMLPETVQRAVDKALIDDQFEIAEINREQLLSGFDAEGNPLGEYRESTKVARRRRGLQTEHIDLRFTGKFQKSFEIDKRGEDYSLTAKDPKWEDKLMQRWPDAIGIQKENEDQVTKVITDNIEFITDNLFK